jgi:tRNA dimethylallyltransferase
LEKRAREGNLQDIYSELKILNPALAMRIDPRNLRRVIRAIEVAHSHGAPPSKQPPKYDSLIIGLTAPRTEVYKRINARIQSMIAEGLVEEVRRLLAKGYNPDLPAMSGIGYRQILRHLNGEIPLSAAIESMNIDSHRLVRQQYNWFKPSDMRIHWFDTTYDVYTDIIHLVKEYLQ